MNKDRIIEILSEIAILLELTGENPFKSRAYVNGARSIELVGESLEVLNRENRLSEIKGVGEALQKKIQELLNTGRLEYYEELKASIPPGLLEMLQIPGLGPKKVRALWKDIGIDSIERLEVACRDGRVANLSGFGQKTQVKILEGIEFRRQHASKYHLSEALKIAEPILEMLRAHPNVIRCSMAGSARRWKEVVGDLDFVVSSDSPNLILDEFVSLSNVQKVIARGDTKASVTLEAGMQADLRVVKDEQYAFALAYFTGSKEHNIVMRQRAIERGLRLNEYGLVRAEDENSPEARGIICPTEDDLYSSLGLHFVPPELREDRGEFERAIHSPYPRLVEWTDLRGSLHNHSNWSDGRGGLEEIASVMIDLGCAYWAITDHSKSSFQANGLDAKRLNQQISEIRSINNRLAESEIDFRLLTGSEVDILSQGDLDFGDEVLSQLDVVVASIHQGFSQTESELTKRLIKAAENPYVHVLGHMTGRLLLERDAYKVDHRAVIDACAATGTWIELNSNPYRFDMDWRHWAYALERGVRCVINCDAHRHEHAGYLRLGAGIARKGGLRPQDVINCLSLKDLRDALAQKRQRLGN